VRSTQSPSVIVLTDRLTPVLCGPGRAEIGERVGAFVSGIAVVFSHPPPLDAMASSRVFERSP
jgi:hypothetical protein